VRSVGTFIYELFGKVQTVQAFNYIKDISLTWSFSFPIQGNWDFNIYIALPSSVSFIGINFGFTVYFSVIVDIYGRGNPIVNCVYNFDIDTYVGT
jgi:hypothetical protein